MDRLPRVLALVALLLGAVSCGSDSDYKPPPGSHKFVDHDAQRLAREAKEKREAGELLQEGDGYWYVRPKGWRNRTHAYQNFMPFLDSAAAERADREIFADVLTVTVLNAGPYVHEPLEDQQTAFARHLRTLATDVHDHKVVMIDHKIAVHHSGTARGGAFEARLDQYVTISWDQLYVIMFKTDVDVTDKAREHRIEKVLDSWHWSR